MKRIQSASCMLVVLSLAATYWWSGQSQAIELPRFQAMNGPGDPHVEREYKGWGMPTVPGWTFSLPQLQPNPSQGYCDPPRYTKRPECKLWPVTNCNDPKTKS